MNGFGIGLVLLFCSACVMTPVGEVITDGTVSVDPHVVYSSRSRVTIGIGPSYTTNDAFILANRHCQGYGYYAVPSRSWVTTYHRPRQLIYNCRRRPVIVTPPVVTRPPHRHPQPPRRVITKPPRRNSGWWSGNRPSTSRPDPRPTPPRPDRPRAGKPSSPWTYNPRKSPQPSKHERGQASKRPSHNRSGSDTGSKNSSPGWWGKNQK